MNLIDMDKLRKDLMTKGDNIPIHEVFNTIWDQPLVKVVPKEKIDEAIKKMEELKEQENKGICFYYPPYYSERCIDIVKEACK